MEKGTGRIQPRAGFPGAAHHYRYASRFSFSTTGTTGAGLRESALRPRQRFVSVQKEEENFPCNGCAQMAGNKGIRCASVNENQPLMTNDLQGQF
jgi:hypothetical protein